jgi:hypothetical protein
MKAFFLFISTIVISSFFVSCGSKGDEIVSKDSTVLLYSEFHDFESANHATVSADRAFSGKKSSIVTPTTEYGFGIFKTLSEIPSYGSINLVRVTLNTWMDKSYPGATLVMSIDDPSGNKNIIWDGKPLNTNKPSEWGYSDFVFYVKKEWLQPYYNMRLYIWNKEKNTFYNDNLRIEVFQVIKKN